MGILTRFRSARTGQYTTGAEAKANEDTTVRETVRVAPLGDGDVLVRVSREILALMKSGNVEPVVILGVRDLGDGTHEMTLARPR